MWFSPAPSKSSMASTPTPTLSSASSSSTMGVLDNLRPRSTLQSRLLTKGWLAPIVGVILVTSMLGTVYLLAVLKGGLDPLLPFVSETATFGPQAALFSQFLCVIGLLEVISFLIRHEQVKCMTNRLILFDCDKRRLLCINRWGTVFGLIHGLIMPSVGNFRTTEYPLIHLISAMILIIVFNLNVLTTIYLTRRLYNVGLETAPTSMAINGALLTITNISLAVSSVVHVAIENPQFGILLRVYSNLHNIPAILQWLSFCQISFHMLCLSSRMRQFAKQQNWIVQK